MRNDPSTNNIDFSFGSKKKFFNFLYLDFIKKKTVERRIII